MRSETLATAPAAAAPLSPRDSAAEANHRIANNLALVGGMVRVHARNVARSGVPLSSDEVCQLLHEIGVRIDAVARLHSLLATGEHGESIDLADYLHEVSAIVVSSLGAPGRTTLTHDTSRLCPVAADRAVTIGLLVGELVTNAVKYAHPAGVRGVISVGCSQTDDGIMVYVTDDGVGLPEGFDPAKDGGLGLRLAHSLADQLQARLAFDDHGTGLSVTLHMAAY